MYGRTFFTHAATATRRRKDGRINPELNEITITKLVSAYFGTEKAPSRDDTTTMSRLVTAAIKKEGVKTVLELQGRAKELTRPSARYFRAHGEISITAFYCWLTNEKDILAQFQPTPAAPVSKTAAATEKKTGVVDFGLDNTVLNALIAAFHAEEMKKERPFGQDRETNLSSLNTAQERISFDIKSNFQTVRKLKDLATSITDNRTAVWQQQYTYPFCAWIKAQPLTALIDLAREAKKAEVAARPHSHFDEPRRRYASPRLTQREFSDPWKW